MSCDEGIIGLERRCLLDKQQQELLTKARALLNARITYRELECGKLLMSGCSVAVIAELLKISQRTAECYIRSLKLKCGCSDRWHLIVYLQQCFGVTINSSKLDLTILDRSFDIDHSNSKQSSTGNINTQEKSSVARRSKHNDKSIV